MSFHDSARLGLCHFILVPGGCMSIHDSARRISVTL